MKRSLVCIMGALLIASCLAGCKANVKVNGEDVWSFGDESSVLVVDEDEPSEVDSSSAEELSEVESATSQVEAVSNGAEAGLDAAKVVVDTQGLGDKWVDLDNMAVEVNGVTYVVGKSTLQDMIDGGVKFDEEDLMNAGNNLNKGTESSDFKVYLDEYWSMIVCFANFSDTGKTLSDCVLSSVYMPVRDEEEYEMTVNKVKFAFDMKMSMDDLKQNAGEPTDYMHYDSETDPEYYSDTLRYEDDGVEYFGKYGYSFEFMKGELSYVRMSWKP